MIRIVMFDLDGTIIDTMEDYADIAATIISRETGISWEKAREKYLSTAGMDFLSQLELLGIGESQRRAIYYKFIEAKKGILAGKSIPMHTRIFLERLRDLGLRLALSTNNECVLVKRIKGVQLFDDLLCFDGKGFRKGKPHLNFIRTKYMAGVDEVLFIGDTEYDLKVYSMHGVKTVKTRGLYIEEEAIRVYRLLKKIIFRRDRDLV